MLFSIYDNDIRKRFLFLFLEVRKVPTISDVAKLAGVSVSTVSRVINNKKYVKEEKRAAVIAAMKELDYQPSSIAIQLRGQRSKILGVIVPRITNPFFSYLVDAIQKQAYNRNYQIMIFQSNESAEKETVFLELMQQKRIDGIILCAVENDEKTIASYSKYGPIVLCNERFENGKLPTVSLDHEEGAYMGVKFLLEKGYRKIGYCTGAGFEEEYMERTRGVKRALAEYNLTVNKDWYFTQQLTIEDGQRLAYRYQKLKDKPDAIFTGSDEVAAGFISKVQTLGVAIPNEVAVIGYDNQLISELTTPDITTIDQSITEIGKQTMNMMFSLLEGQEYQINTEKLQMEIIIRGST